MTGTTSGGLVVGAAVGEPVVEALGDAVGEALPVVEGESDADAVAESLGGDAVASVGLAVTSAVEMTAASARV